jgi:hypothetical protein
MASSSDDKEKTPPEDDTKDFRLKEEVESEDEEEDQGPRPNTVIASIGVVTDHDKFKKSARIRTGGGVPRHTLAPRTSSLADRFMNRIEHNSEMIRNLEYKIDDLKDLIEKLIKDYPPPPPKE